MCKEVGCRLRGGEIERVLTPNEEVLEHRSDVAVVASPWIVALGVEALVEDHPARQIEGNRYLPAFRLRDRLDRLLRLIATSATTTSDGDRGALLAVDLVAWVPSVPLVPAPRECDVAGAAEVGYAELLTAFLAHVAGDRAGRQCRPPPG